MYSIWLLKGCLKFILLPLQQGKQWQGDRLGVRVAGDWESRETGGGQALEERVGRQMRGIQVTTVLPFAPTTPCPLLPVCPPLVPLCCLSPSSLVLVHPNSCAHYTPCYHLPPRLSSPSAWSPCWLPPPLLLLPPAASVSHYHLPFGSSSSPSPTWGMEHVVAPAPAQPCSSSDQALELEPGLELLPALLLGLAGARAITCFIPWAGALSELEDK